MMNTNQQYTTQHHTIYNVPPSPPPIIIEPSLQPVSSTPASPSIEPPSHLAPPFEKSPCRIVSCSLSDLFTIKSPSFSCNSTPDSLIWGFSVAYICMWKMISIIITISFIIMFIINIIIIIIIITNLHTLHLHHLHQMIPAVLQVLQWLPC